MLSILDREHVSEIKGKEPHRQLLAAVGTLAQGREHWQQQRKEGRRWAQEHEMWKGAEGSGSIERRGKSMDR